MMLTFNVDHWTWITDHEQMLANHESHDHTVDLDVLIDVITATNEDDDQ